MKNRYTCKTLTNPDDMLSTYELALLLNPRITTADYIETLNNACKTSNYRQIVALKDDKPVSFVAIQDVVLMKCAPKKSMNISNIATLPDERGAVTQMLFAVIKQIAIDEGYGNMDVRSSKQNIAASKCYEKNGFQNEESYAWRMKIAGESNQRAKL